MCYELQANAQVTPGQVEHIHHAMLLLRESPFRSMTDFVHTVQDVTVRTALGQYTMDGTFGHLLDAREDGLARGDFQVFELPDLLSLGPQAVLAVLEYLFRRFHQALHGQPALLMLDEASVMFGHPVFRAKIVEWLKELRKANCAVLLATQSLSDATKSGILDVLQESCPSKVFLPNEEADKGGTATYAGPRDLYAAFGLNEAQIALVRHAVRRRDYYYVSPEGRRVFDLGLGPVALAFVAVSDKEQLATVKHLQQEWGAEWPYRWLDSRGVKYAHYLEKMEARGNSVRARVGNAA